MTDEQLRRALLSLPPPDELEAQRRTWRTVRAAYDAREPVAWPRRHPRPILAFAVAAALLAAIVSPPGRALVGEVRDAIGREKVVGVKQAKPALFSLPADGRLLVTSPKGPWIVNRDGSKRRLGAYDEASWSPSGIHVVATRGPRLVAVRPPDQVRWTLARPGRVTKPRWAPSGFRIAYLNGDSIRVVAGDQTGDRLLGDAQAVAPAWKPEKERHVLAYVDGGGTITVVEADTEEVLWSASLATGVPLQLEWSVDGERLLVLAGPSELGDFRFFLEIFDAEGETLGSRMLRGGAGTVAFAPDEHGFALARSLGPRRSEVLLLDADELGGRPQRIFEGAGRFSELAWSPDGRWLLVAWPSADQLLFVRSADVEEVKAFSNVAREFDPGGLGPAKFPGIAGWCCVE